MSGIEAINHQPKFTAPKTPEQRKENQEKVAAGAGGAAGVTGTAAKAVSKRAAKIEAKEQMLQQGMEKANRVCRTINKNTQEAEGLLATFRINVKRYTDDIIKRISKLQDSKFLAPIVKSPITKNIASVCGGALAFFVLVTGVSKACRTGAIAVDNFKNQYHEFNG